MSLEDKSNEQGTDRLPGGQTEKAGTQGCGVQACRHGTEEAKCCNLLMLTEIQVHRR